VNQIRQLARESTHFNVTSLLRMTASESDSLAGRAGRGLVELCGTETSDGILFTCRTSRQGSSQSVACVRPRRARSSLLAVAMATLFVSCASPGASLVECPLSSEQQQQAVLEVVPWGTARVDAERRLREAGIEFFPGQRNSSYYLGLWKRPDGKRWHIKVALLFYKEGKLYQTRPSDSATEPLPKDFQADRSSPEANSSKPDSLGADSRRGAAGANDSGTTRDDELYRPWPEEVDSKKKRR